MKISVKLLLVLALSVLISSCRPAAWTALDDAPLLGELTVSANQTLKLRNSSGELVDLESGVLGVRVLSSRFGTSRIELFNQTQIFPVKFQLKRFMTPAAVDGVWLTSTETGQAALARVFTVEKTGKPWTVRESRVIKAAEFTCEAPAGCVDISPEVRGDFDVTYQEVRPSVIVEFYEADNFGPALGRFEGQSAKATVVEVAVSAAK